MTREAFVTHVGREIVEALPRPERSTVKRLARTVTRTTGGHSFGVKGTQIRSAAEQVTHEQGPAERFEALKELVEVAREAGHPMVLIVEDTDPYMPPPGGSTSETEATQLAASFIQGPVQWLAREATCPSLVAVHDGHAGLLDGPIEQISLPPFSDASEAIGSIAVRYLRQKGLHVDHHADLIEERALAFLAGLLRERSLRHVLRLLPDAAERAIEDDPQTSVIRFVDVANVS